MSFYEVLTVVTCVTSTMTMIIVGVAILPHFKTGLAVVRDAVLWASLVLVLAVIGWLGLRQLADHRAKSQAESAGLETLETSARSAADRTPPVKSDDSVNP